MCYPESILRSLPDYSKWRKLNGEQFSLADYAKCVSTPDILLGLFTLLQPKIVQHEGAYFLEPFNIETYNEWRQQGISLTEIQKVMNHVHLINYMGEGEFDVEIVILIGEKIAQIWRALFRDLGITAECLVGETTEDVSVTLYSSSY